MLYQRGDVEAAGPIHRLILFIVALVGALCIGGGIAIGIRSVIKSLYKLAALP